MTLHARLITSITLPAVAEECAVTLQCRPDRVVRLARTDDRLVAHDLDRVMEGVLGPIAYPGGDTPDSPVGFGRGRWLTCGGRGRYDIWALV